MRCEVLPGGCAAACMGSMAGGGAWLLDVRLQLSKLGRRKYCMHSEVFKVFRQSALAEP